MTATSPSLPERSRRRNLMRHYDRSNDQAARLILACPEKSNQPLTDWAQRYTVSRAQESRKVGSPQ
jgi:hypothetical protein